MFRFNVFTFERERSAGCPGRSAPSDSRGRFLIAPENRVPDDKRHAGPSLKFAFSLVVPVGPFACWPRQNTRAGYRRSEAGYHRDQSGAISSTEKVMEKAVGMGED